MHRNLRVSVLTQHHIDYLSFFFNFNAIEYTRKQIDAYKKNEKKIFFSLPNEFQDVSELDIRAHLGNFGISGNVALQSIGSLLLLFFFLFK
jgi:ATPase subunit of ABC transporter with duplicated ATPase domains